MFDATNGEKTENLIGERVLPVLLFLSFFYLWANDVFFKVSVSNSLITTSKKRQLKDIYDGDGPSVRGHSTGVG